jgi:hypothetical protein
MLTGTGLCSRYQLPKGNIYRKLLFHYSLGRESVQASHGPRGPSLGFLQGRQIHPTTYNLSWLQTVKSTVAEEQELAGDSSRGLVQNSWIGPFQLGSSVSI